MYHKVYSPDVQMFEVPYERARKLLAQDWTLTYPEDLSSVFMRDEIDWSEDEAAEFEQHLALMAQDA